MKSLIYQNYIVMHLCQLRAKVLHCALTIESESGGKFPQNMKLCSTVTFKPCSNRVQLKLSSSPLQDQTWKLNTSDAILQNMLLSSYFRFVTKLYPCLFIKVRFENICHRPFFTLNVFTQIQYFFPKYLEVKQHFTLNKKHLLGWM